MKSYLFAGMQSVYSKDQPTTLSYKRNPWKEVLSLCRNAIGVFKGSADEAVMHRTHVEGSLIPLQECGRCIQKISRRGCHIQDTRGRKSCPSAGMQSGYLKDQPTKLSCTGNTWKQVLSLCRNAVGVFKGSPDVAVKYRTHVEGSLIPLQECSRCIQRITRRGCQVQDTCGRKSYPFAGMQSVYSKDQPTTLSYKRNPWKEVLSLCRNAVGVFKGSADEVVIHRTHVEAILIPLQECSRCIQKISRRGCHIQDTRWMKSYPSAEIQSVYSKDQLTRLSHTRHSLDEVLSLCRDTGSSRLG